MIRHLRHEAIDKQEWDRHLSSCPGPTWYARSAVLDVASPGWEALVDEDGSRMPLTWSRRFGVDYLRQPFLLQQLGVFATGTAQGHVVPFLEALPRRFRYADIYLRPAKQPKPTKGFEISEHTDLCLRLDEDIPDLRAAYSSNHRRNLRRAHEAGLRLDEQLDPGRFLEFVLGSSQAARWKLSDEQRRVFRGLLALSVAEGNARVLGVRNGRDALLAAGWFVQWQGRSYFLKGLAAPEGREERAMFLLLDQHISDIAGRAGVLDLAGSDDPALARFYAGFGAGRHVYLRALMNRLPAPVRWMKP